MLRNLTLEFSIGGRERFYPRQAEARITLQKIDAGESAGPYREHVALTLPMSSSLVLVAVVEGLDMSSSKREYADVLHHRLAAPLAVSA